MSFGTAASLDDVPTYLASVRGGRPAPDELVAEFRRRFQRVGGSPLTRITREQAAALEERLNRRSEASSRSAVEAGMRHAPPFIAEGLRRLADRGATEVVGVILSPQYSPTIMGGYLRAVEAARPQVPHGTLVRVAGAWHDAPPLVDALAERLREALERLPDGARARVPVLFTGHSLPKSVADGEPEYIEQLRETARQVAGRAGLAAHRWQFAYQSAGHTPEEWLTPDVKDLLPELRAAGHGVVLVAPVQFVADHLEVLYDIDVAAREEAAALGIDLRRTASLHTMPTFIEALAWVVEREIGKQERPQPPPGRAVRAP